MGRAVWLAAVHTSTHFFSPFTFHLLHAFFFQAQPTLATPCFSAGWLLLDLNKSKQPWQKINIHQKKNKVSGRNLEYIRHRTKMPERKKESFAIFALIWKPPGMRTCQVLTRHVILNRDPSRQLTTNPGFLLVQSHRDHHMCSYNVFQWFLKTLHSNWSSNISFKEKLKMHFFLFFWSAKSSYSKMLLVLFGSFGSALHH